MRIEQNRKKILEIKQNEAQHTAKVQSKGTEVLHKDIQTVDPVSMKESGLYVNLNTTGADNLASPKISVDLMAGKSEVKICELWDYISYMKKDCCSLFHQEFDVGCILFLCLKTCNSVLIYRS